MVVQANRQDHAIDRRVLLEVTSNNEARTFHKERAGFARDDRLGGVEVTAQGRQRQKHFEVVPAITVIDAKTRLHEQPTSVGTINGDDMLEAPTFILSEGNRTSGVHECRHGTWFSFVRGWVSRREGRRPHARF